MLPNNPQRERCSKCGRVKGDIQPARLVHRGETREVRLCPNCIIILKADTGDEDITRAAVRVDDIDIYVGEPEREYEFLGDIHIVVTGVGLASKAPTIEDANLRLREEAAPLGADAVVGVVYSRGIGLFAWKELRATGTAVVLAKNPSLDSANDGLPQQSLDIGGRLRQLEELRSAQLITESEYQAKRAKLLDYL